MAFVKLFYGPYEAHGMIRHKPQRLHGLIGCLTEKGYEVEIVSSEHINRLTVEMKNRIIFRCDIRFLLFNLECEDDAVCQRIINVIREAEGRFYNELNMPRYASTKQGLRYIQKLRTITTGGYFDSDVALLYEIQEKYKTPEEKPDENIVAPAATSLQLLTSISGVILTSRAVGGSKSRIGRVKSTERMRSVERIKSFEKMKIAQQLKSSENVRERIYDDKNIGTSRSSLLQVKVSFVDSKFDESKSSM